MDNIIERTYKVSMVMHEGETEMEAERRMVDAVYDGLCNNAEHQIDCVMVDPMANREKMRKVEITWEQRKRVSETCEVSQEEYYEVIMKGGLPGWIKDILEDEIDSGTVETDWAVNDEHGNTIVDWND